MERSAVRELLRQFRDRGILRADAALLAVATLVGWNENRAAPDGRSLFRDLASRLQPDGVGGGVEAAEDWLSDPGLSATEWELVDRGLSELERLSAPIDWTAEVAACLDPHFGHGNFGLSMPIGKAIARLLDYPIAGSFACLQSGSASIAWVLAEDREVTLFAEREVAIMLTLLARAACRTLKVSRRNPLDGTFMPGPFVFDGPNHRPPFDRFDFIFSIPAFGGRISDGPAKGTAFEAFYLERLMDRGTKSFTALVPDGVLFRETKFETELRWRMVDEHRVTVMSMPSGMYWPASGVSTSLLVLEPGNEKVRFIDGRSMEQSSSGRVRERQIVQHLEGFRGLRPKQSERDACVATEEVAANNFSLLPDRYLKSGTLAQVEEMLESRPVVSLVEIASIERNKAPLPLREAVEDPALTALEVAPKDVAQGMVRMPSRQQAFEHSEAPRVKGVTVKADDILVSIKGNIGNVGIADIHATASEVMHEPWIVSQSLAIVRWKPNPHIPSAKILNALLTAPWVREKLESMAGGSTVKSLPVSALRGLTIPVPTAEECAEAEEELRSMAKLRDQIEKQQDAVDERQRELWARLWQVPADIGED